MNQLMKQESGLQLEQQKQGYNELTQDGLRAMQEVQGQIVMAKKFPRDEMQAISRITRACQRKGLAKTAMYSFPRGGQVVSGPSIRLAEVLAQNWGNLDFGIRELEQRNGESIVESYCWDLETNTKQKKVFKVKHERKARGQMRKLEDTRDIYELVANQATRRLRACILSIIPADVVDSAVEACNKTLESGHSEPIIDRIKKMVVSFDGLGVSQDMLTKRLGHDVSITIETELIELQKIFLSIKDKMTKREDWFEFDKKNNSTTELLNEKFKIENK